jgi:Ca2+:H+ antiporter
MGPSGTITVVTTVQGSRPVRPPLVSGAVVRRILFAGLALGPIVVALNYLTNLGDTALFVLSAIALIPLAWLIGEATEHAATHTGPGIGGFLNATFGNAPELIIALIAINEGLTEVLLVLGFSLLAGGRGEIERWSSFLSFALVGLAIGLFLIPSIASWSSGADAQRVVDLSVPVSIALLILYAGVTIYTLRRHHVVHVSSDEEIGGWSLRAALATLGVATVVTALVAETLVGSLEEFAHKAGLSDFFVAAVIVAIVGNAAEHGGAVIVAYRGKIKLAAEIALSSSAQVAVFLIPAVTLLSWLIDPLALGFRKVEIGALALALGVVMATIWGGTSSRLRGGILVAAYIGVAAMFFVAGDG